MSSVVHVSEAASLALHTLTLLAAAPMRVFTTKQIASSLHASEAHLSKVLQRLGKVGLVRSARGPKGGFMLGKAAEAITLLETYESIDGPLQPKTCLLRTPVCKNSGQCVLGGLLESVYKQVRECLAGARVSDLAGQFGGEDADA